MNHTGTATWSYGMYEKFYFNIHIMEIFQLACCQVVNFLFVVAVLLLDLGNLIDLKSSQLGQFPAPFLIVSV